MCLGLARRIGIRLLVVLTAATPATNAHGDDVEPGLWLEMALLACSRGEQEEAERLFRHIETHFSPPPGIQALIDEARSRWCRQVPRLQMRWAAGLGWSSNVNQAASTHSLWLSERLPALELTDVKRPLSDPQALLEADAQVRVPYGEMGAVAQLRHHGRHHDFDEDILGLTWRGPVWREGGLVAALSRARSWLGGRPYADYLGLQVSWPMQDWTAQARWQEVDYVSAPAFSAQVYTLAAGRQWPRGSGPTSVRLGVSWDRAEGQRPGGDRHGGFGELRLHHPGPGRSRFELAGLYDVRLSEQAYLPGLLEMRRRQRTLRADLGWSWPVGRDGGWRVGLTLVEVRDNVSFLAYRQTILAVQWIQAHAF